MFIFGQKENEETVLDEIKGMRGKQKDAQKDGQKEKEENARNVKRRRKN
tara:strand:+ start:319 stop:465 length:147 start_codon:yes stop_codon:yes gene_type:complete